MRRQILPTNFLTVFTLGITLMGSITPLEAQRTKKNAQASAITQIAKKPLHHSVYDSWQDIPEQAISNNGQYTAFVVAPQQGNGTLYIYKKGNTTPIATLPRGAEVKFTHDSQFAVFKIKPQFEKVKEAKRAKKKADEMPKDSLGLLTLQTGAVVKWPTVVSYRLPEKGAQWLAFLHSGTNKAQTSSDSTASKKGAKSKKYNDENGHVLTIKRLSDQQEHHYPYVKEYTFSKEGNRLGFVSAGHDTTLTAGVYVQAPTQEQPLAIVKGHSKHTYKKLNFDEAGTQLAFLADLDTNSKTQVRSPKLAMWKAGDAQAQFKVDQNNQPGGQNWLVNGDYTPNFSKDGQLLFFGTNPTPVVPDTTLLPEEIVNLEVWHWQDKRLQTQQKVTAAADKKKAYLASLDLNTGKSIQLASNALESVSLIAEGDAQWALLSDQTNYSHEHWDWNPKMDVYLINTKTGQKRLVKEKLEGRPSVSPSGKYVVWFSNPDSAWFAYDTEKATTVALTDQKGVRFTDETDDHPDYPRAYGIAGWATNETSILLYDRFDIWQVNLQQPATKNRLTSGREINTSYRYVKLDADEKHIDLSKPLLLRSFNEVSKQEGFHHLVASTKQLEKRFEGDFKLGATVRKAREADDLIFTKETFQEYPNWNLTDLKFKNIQQITTANPQQANYKWGTVELVNWTAADGTPLQGLLYKPENFDPKKKYPMMTYFYERNSDNIHTHFVPKPIRSYINFSYFTSNDYIVFVPDIVYKDGYPGESAYNCIMPGVLSLLEKGFVDKDRLGVSGHSWGGYQTAYLVTRTNLFKAAEAGAPVVNMTSAYGGVRWDTGLVRQAQYERTQSRIGGTLWEKPFQYIENSPLFFAPKVETPLLMMHNDEDGAVPWYQGIEYYLALKRLNKPVWMLNYVGEKHGLTKRQNMTDFTIRLYQFFDHYLKDAPMPEWMANGLPYIEKGIKQGLEPVK